MQSSLKEKLARKVFTSKGFLFLLIIATIWVVLICLKITNKRYQMAREISNIQQEIDQLKKENQDLAVAIESFNNPSFLEKEAKRRLNLRKEGEEVVILPKNEFSDNQTTTPEINQENSFSNESQNQSVNKKEESNLAKWWRYFFK
jgi:cell division protein FtsL